METSAALVPAVAGMLDCPYSIADDVVATISRRADLDWDVERITEWLACLFPPAYADPEMVRFVVARL